MVTYCWYKTADLEHVRGPFDTVQAALADVLASFSEEADCRIEVAEVVNILPEDYADVIGVDEMCDRMDAALGEDAEIDDPVFDVPPPPLRLEAEEALADALAAWAKKYVTVADARWTAGITVQTAMVSALRYVAGGGR